MKMFPRISLVATTLVLSIALDQWTKRIAADALRSSPGHSFLGDTFRLVYAENYGAFLSLGASLSHGARFWILNVSVGLLLLGIVAYSVLSKLLTPLQVTAYALIASGGLSNWVDRATNNGAVVDFMNLGIGPVRTGIFNVADLAIVAGIVMLVLWGQRKGPEAAPVSTGSPAAGG